MLENSTFMDHSYRGTSSSKALELILSTATIIHCPFINLNGSLYDMSTSDTPDSISHGGAIASYQSNLVIIGSNFKGNSANLGGAMYATTECDIIILNSTFTNNQAVCYKENCMDENLSDSTSGQGGAIVLLESRLLIRDLARVCKT